MPPDLSIIACLRVGDLLDVKPESMVMLCEDCQASIHVHPHSLEIKLSQPPAIIVCNQCAIKRCHADEEPILVVHPVQDAEFGAMLRERYGAVSIEEAEEIARKRQ